nr:DoxX family protein [Hyphomonas sp. Mor2]
MIASSNLSDWALVGGRIALASLFILGGLNKVLNYTATLASMEAVGLSPPPLLLPLVIGLELIGGALVGFGRRGATLAALALAMFTLSTNIFFHDFWNMDGDIAALELSLFFKNVSIAGGLLFFAGAVASRPIARERA